MTDYQITEYEKLREEINQKIELHNTLLTFTVTTSIAILSFAMTQKEALFFLIPYGIIIPMSIRIAYYHSAMAKLAAYIIVFLEPNLDGINWETRNALLINNQLRKKWYQNCFTVQRYYECLVLSILCYVLYVSAFVTNAIDNMRSLVFLLFPLLLLILEIGITIRMNAFHKIKQE